MNLNIKYLFLVLGLNESGDSRINESLRVLKLEKDLFQVITFSSEKIR